MCLRGFPMPKRKRPRGAHIGAIRQNKRWKTPCERRLSNAGPKSLARRRAVVGPHADRLEFFVEGKNASSFASQGQQRCLVLAWKVAEVELVQEIAGTKPVLLLDDVMSELDEHRRRALVDLLHQDIQTFITATDMSYFDDDIKTRARVVDLAQESGRF